MTIADIGDTKLSWENLLLRHQMWEIRWFIIKKFPINKFYHFAGRITNHVQTLIISKH